MKLGCKVAILGALALSAAPLSASHAAPLLQLFIEKSTGNNNTTSYDTADEDWVEVGTDPFRLWAIAKTGGGGGSTFDGLVLVTSFASSLGALTHSILSFSGSTTGGAGGYTDPSIAAAPTTIGGLNVGIDHPHLPPGGGFGPARSWLEWDLGPASLTDSPIGDFEPTSGVSPFFGASDYPTKESDGDLLSQINVYDLTVSGLDPGQQVRFDLYGYNLEEVCLVKVRGVCTQSEIQKVVGGGDKAPYSHNARWEQGASTSSGGGGGGGSSSGGGDIPEPATIALLGAGLFGLGLARRRNRI